MRNLNDLVEEMVKVELEMTEGVRTDNMEDVDAALFQMMGLIDDLGKLVGLDTFYLRQFARQRLEKTRRAA